MRGDRIDLIGARQGVDDTEKFPSDGPLYDPSFGSLRFHFRGVRRVENRLDIGSRQPVLRNVCRVLVRPDESHQTTVSQFRPLSRDAIRRHRSHVGQKLVWAAERKGQRLALLSYYQYEIVRRVIDLTVAFAGCPHGLANSVSVIQFPLESTS